MFNSLPRHFFLNQVAGCSISKKCMSLFMIRSNWKGLPSIASFLNFIFLLERVCKYLKICFQWLLVYFPSSVAGWGKTCIVRISNIMHGQYLFSDAYVLDTSPHWGSVVDDIYIFSLGCRSYLKTGSPELFSRSVIRAFP